MEADRAGAGVDERARFADPFAVDATGPAPDPPPPTPKLLPGKQPGAGNALRDPAFRALRATQGAWEADRSRGAAFLFLPILLGAGALTYFTLPFEPSLLVLVVPVLAGLCAAAVTGGRPAARLFAIGLTAYSSGLLAGKSETLRAGTKMLGAEVTTRVTARVVRIEAQASGRFRLTLDVVSTERPALRHAPDRVRLTSRAIPDDLAPGDLVGGVARLMPPSGPVRPGSYDFAYESYFAGIGATGFFMIGPERSLREDARGTGIAARVETMRRALAGRVAAAIGGDAGHIAAALIAGVRSGIPEKVNEDLRRTGLAHVLSISGLHMALVAASVMTMLRALFALFPQFASRHPVKKYAATAALLATAFYLVVSGGAIAAQRAFVMIAVMLVAVLFDRAAITMRNLAIAGLIILAIAPHEVTGPSFQMSFAATAALIAVYGAWSRRRMARIGSYRPPATRFGKFARTAWLYLLGLSVTAIVAGTASGLYGAWHFHRVASLGLVSNLAAMPFVSALVMPFAVLSVVVMPFGLEAWPLAVMGAGIDTMLAIAAWLSERSPFDVVGAIRLDSLLLLTAALALSAVLTGRLLLIAVAPLAIGVALLAMPHRPEVYISEDARLVGLALPGGAFAVNRPRPSAFTTGNWLHAAARSDVVGPRRVEDAADSLRKEEEGFACAGDLCMARTAGGWPVAHAATAEAADAACGIAHLVVVAQAHVEGVCDGGPTIVVSARDLARRGAATVSFDGSGAATIAHAVAQPLRPWHEHRAWSRAARGLASREPRSQEVR
jgi:ComEC/Rec2-related protein